MCVYIYVCVYIYMRREVLEEGGGRARFPRENEVTFGLKMSAEYPCELWEVKE